jgi:hypothetical protein
MMRYSTNAVRLQSVLRRDALLRVHKNTSLYSSLGTNATRNQKLTGSLVTFFANHVLRNNTYKILRRALCSQTLFSKVTVELEELGLNCHIYSFHNAYLKFCIYAIARGLRLPSEQTLHVEVFLLSTVSQKG